MENSRMYVKLVSSIESVTFVYCMLSRVEHVDLLLKQGTSFARLMMSEITPKV